MIITSDKDIARFKRYVPQGEPNDCWLWLGHTDRYLYGIFKTQDKNVRAPRVAWDNNQDIPPDKLVLHSCDTPTCVNPCHLRIGTASDNRRDAFARGRVTTGAFAGSLKGEQHPSARFTETDIIDIRRRVAEGQRQAAVARLYNCSYKLIWKIVNKEIWRHI